MNTGKNENIIKGLNRIALVIAILFILPGFLTGWKTYFHLNKQDIPAQKLEWAEKDKMFKPLRMSILEDLYYPPKWKCGIAGLAGSGIAFAFVLFGLRGLNRVFIWRIVIWITESFKDGKLLTKNGHIESGEGVITASKCEHCGHHEIGVTIQTGEYVPLRPGMKVKIIGKN